MFVVLLFSFILHADYILDVDSSKFIEADIYLNGYKTNKASFLNYVKIGDNKLRVCFKNKTGKYLPIKKHVRVDLQSLTQKTTDIVVDGALTEVKAAPILSFYSLNSNSKSGWVCESKVFTHNGNNYLYFHLAQNELKKSKQKKYKLKKTVSKNITKTKVTSKINPLNAINAHQSSIGVVYNKLKSLKVRRDSQVKRNLQALIGSQKKQNILGKWKDKKTGVIYNFTPKHIEVSNMPKGFYMDYRKINSKKLRVKVLNNSFDLLYKMKSQNEMIQKNTQSGVIRELIRL
ncbi:MAG: hypothetical protein MK008_05220 [Bdellovibrionales bacterium]|nr:hypothetical protein [Bdellovibrionales bacterium]